MRHNDALKSIVDDVAAVLDSTDDEQQITTRVAEKLSALLDGGYRLPAEYTRPASDRHVNYPLYIAPGDAWCIAAVVWNMGQQTPVHGHETWGVVGIYAGAERELRYVKPARWDAETPLTPAGEQTFERGQVTVCCTTDDDVHAVTAVGDEPTIGIHIYGGNIGTLRRPSYDPATGAVTWFVSGWDTPPEPGPEGWRLC